MSFGTHLQFDLQGCKKGTSAPHVIYQVLENLVGELKMERLSGPHLASYVDDPKDTLHCHCGIMICEMGHIVLRTFMSSKACLLDVFSCQPVDEAIVLASIKLYFEPDRCDCNEQERGVFRE